MTEPSAKSPPVLDERPTASSVVLSVLLAVAAIGAVLRSVDGQRLTRLAAVVVALVLGWIAAGTLRGRAWALGSAFLLGLFWLWAAVALGLQQRFGAGEAALWISWSVGVIVTSIGAREPGERDA